MKRRKKEKKDVEKVKHNIILPNKYLGDVSKRGRGVRVSLARKLHRRRHKITHVAGVSRCKEE